MHVKELINKIKFDKKENPEDYTLTYRDFEKEKEIKFTDIKKLEGNFMIVNSSNIPLHRIRKVLKKGEIVWERK